MNYPLKKIFVTQKWGVNGDMYSRFGFKGHNGVDLRLFNTAGNRSSTALVYAPHDGVVKERRNDADGYGNYLKIESGVEGSILGHLKEFKVNINKIVKQGDLIAVADNTGWSTGAHLHWGYYRHPRNRQNGYGGTIDPTPHIVESSIISDTPSIEAGMEIKDSTKIDLGKDLGVMEVHAIRSSLLDGRRDFTSLEKKYKELLDKPESSLTEDQLLTIGDTVKKAVENGLAFTNGKVKIVQNTLDSLNNTLDGDRENIGKMSVDQASLLTEFREFKTLLSSQTQKIVDKVSDTVESGVLEVSKKLAEAVKVALKGFINKESPIKEKTIWEKLIFWK